MPKLFSIFFFLLLFAYASVSFTFSSSTIIFQDNFTISNPTKWVVTRNIGNSIWKIENGMYMVKFNFPGVSESVPKDEYWNQSWNDYAFDVDMDFISGIDKNLAFRYKDAENWYGIHFSGGLVSLQKVINGIQPPSFPIEIIKDIPNGASYHVRVEVVDEKIKVIVNNEILFDYTDNQDPLLIGKPALQASAGDDPESEVWFDNVVVTALGDTPIPEDKVPVVILPGLGGSFSYKNLFLGMNDDSDWSITPTVKVYDNLIASFKKAGYELNKNLFVFLYDWRKPLEEDVPKLESFIRDKVNSLNNRPESSKVNLIGHSLGGLVINTYIQKSSDPLVSNAITLGSPHQGAIEAYSALSGGDLQRSNLSEWLLTEMLVAYFQKPWETKRDIVLREAPVAFNLLPIFDYLKRNGKIVPYKTLSIKNTLLEDLRSSQSNLSSKSTFITYTGDKLDTLRFLEVVNPPWYEKVQGLWVDGKVNKKIYEPTGDSNLLNYSGLINDPNIKAKTFDNYDHGLIVSGENVINEIFKDLGINSVPEFVATPSQNYLIFMLGSPAKIRVTDPLGQTSGTGWYLSFDNKFVIIPQPLNGIYKVDIIGEGNGDYKLSFGRVIDKESNWRELEGYAANGNVDSFNFIINSNSFTDPLVDNKGEIYKKLISEKINKMKRLMQNYKGNNSIAVTYEITKLRNFFDSPSNNGCDYVFGIEDKNANLRKTLAGLSWSFQKEQLFTLEKDSYDVLNYIINLSKICSKYSKNTTTVDAKKIDRMSKIIENLTNNKNERISGLVFSKALDYFQIAQTEKSKTTVKSKLLLSISDSLLEEASVYAGVR